MTARRRDAGRYPSFNEPRQRSIVFRVRNTNANPRINSHFIIGSTGIILTAILLLLVRADSAVVAQANKLPLPIWEIDLSKFGYQGRPPVTLDPAEHWGFSTYQQGVIFTEPNVVVAFFVAHDDPAGAPAQRKALATDPYRFVAVFLKASSGELIKKLEWKIPTSSDSVPLPHFFPARKGKFLVGIGTTLFLYSQDYRILARYDALNELNPTVSPAGDTVLVHETQQVGGQWISYYRLLDTEQLATEESWQESSGPRSNYALWGNQLTWLEGRSLYVKTPKSEPRRLAESKAGFCGNWDFVSPETIAAVDCSGEEKFVLVKTDGKIIPGFDLGLERINGPIIASQNGQRFAVPSDEWGSGRNENPKKLIARVFNVNSELPLLVLDVPRHYGTGENFGTPYGDTRFGWGGLALSQDGALLAVKSGGIVQLYKVPDLPAANVTDAEGEEEKEAAKHEAAKSGTALPALPRAEQSKLIQQVLSWLPADTEIVLAENGPLPLPKLGEDEAKAREGVDYAAEDAFKGLPFVLFGLSEGLFEKHFEGEPVLFSLEGSRRVRSPAGLGLTPYEGCGITIFAKDITSHGKAFLEDAAKTAFRMEQIQGHEVAVFQGKLENDVWTTYVAFPKPNVAIAASDENYFREVLARIDGKAGNRALPEGLLEWKHVDIHAAVWAVRHYDKKGAEADPTSPFGGKKAANLPDEEAIGITFQFDPAKSWTATIRYLSGAANARENFQNEFSSIENEPGGKQLKARYRQVDAGVVEGSFELKRIESAEIFLFYLMGFLGHAVYV